MVTAPVDKRVVSFSTAGFPTIHGVIDTEKGETYPPSIGPVKLGDGSVATVFHESTKARMIVYRAFVLGNTGKFNDFHPEQR